MSRPLVMVTGGAGFIGSNVVAALTDEDRYDVAVCDRLLTTDLEKWRNLAPYPLADFIAPEALAAWLDGNAGALHAVVHMGAVSSTTETDADLIVQSNFGLSRDLWRWCAQNGTPLIYASSAATYGNGSEGFSDSNDVAHLLRLKPLNAYGWSKAAFDVWAVRQAEAGAAPPRWFGLKFFNVYGPHEQHKGPQRSVAHQIWPQASRGETVKLFKSYRRDYPHGGQRRDFVYVKDCAAVIAWMVQGGGRSGVYNLGTGQARSFADLARAAFAAAGREPVIEYIDMPETLRDKYQYFTQADMTRLRASGWNAPFMSLEDGVAAYGAWLAAREG